MLEMEKEHRGHRGGREGGEGESGMMTLNSTEKKEPGSKGISPSPVTLPFVAQLKACFMTPQV